MHLPRLFGALALAGCLAGCAINGNPNAPVISVTLAQQIQADWPKTETLIAAMDVATHASAATQAQHAADEAKITPLVASVTTETQGQLQAQIAAYVDSLQSPQTQAWITLIKAGAAFLPPPAQAPAAAGN